MWTNTDNLNLSSLAVPPPIEREIQRVVHDVAMLSARSGSCPEVCITIRRRPVDPSGRTGCRIEVRSDAAAPESLMARWPRLAEPLEGVNNAAGISIAVEPAFPQGWKLVLDARWAA